jgi:hypothetical protein
LTRQDTARNKILKQAYYSQMKFKVTEDGGYKLHNDYMTTEESVNTLCFRIFYKRDQTDNVIIYKFE